MLNNKNIIITGARRGIGRTTVEVFASNGANIWACARNSDEIFEKDGLDAYRKYQVKHKTNILETGVAYPFIKRFLRINEIYTKEQPVEVVLLSRNSPETGVRIFNSIREYNLNITRAAFMSGGSAINYIPAFNISLFLAVFCPPALQLFAFAPPFPAKPPV